MKNRQRLNVVLLIVATALLFIVLFNLLPSALQMWHPYDYSRYLEMATALRQNPQMYGAYIWDAMYPLPVQFLVFIPLTFLPDWFRLVWVLIPVISILWLFRRDAMPIFFYIPLWFVMYIGMVDGLFLVPLALLIRNIPIWAGVGAAVLLIKPQVCFLAILYALVQWIIRRDWRNLLAFGGVVGFASGLAFILVPDWLIRMLLALPARANESIITMPLLTAAVWSWWWLGGFGILVCIGGCFTAAWLFWKAWRVGGQRIATVQLLNLILMWVLYAGSFITVLPILRGKKEIVTIVLVSLAAFALDKAMNGFGGGYVLIPLTALYLQTRRRSAVADRQN